MPIWYSWYVSISIRTEQYLRQSIHRKALHFYTSLVVTFKSTYHLNDTTFYSIRIITIIRGSTTTFKCVTTYLNKTCKSAALMYFINTAKFLGFACCAAPKIELNLVPTRNVNALPTTYFINYFRSKYFIFSNFHYSSPRPRLSHKKILQHYTLHFLKAGSSAKVPIIYLLMQVCNKLHFYLIK